MKIKDLAVEHDYYASDNNYFNSEANQSFTTWADYYEEWNLTPVSSRTYFRIFLDIIEVSQHFLGREFYGAFAF